jgi:zinc/manganese transport system ATP-binding protein
MGNTMKVSGVSEGMAVCLRDLTVTYQRHPAIHHVSGGFDKGQLSAIVGPNGAGKSTLLETIAGLRRPTTGQVIVENAVSIKGGPSWAYLPQQSQIDRHFPIRVVELVTLGAWQTLRSWRESSAVIHQKMQRALEQVGLHGFERRFLNELSVGQFQRVLFARILMQDAPLVLLDEPFTGLDARTTSQLLILLHQWQKQGRTVIAALHELELVRQHFVQTLLLAREQVAWGPTHEVLSDAHLTRAQQMAEDWEENAPDCLYPSNGGTCGTGEVGAQLPSFTGGRLT